MLNINQTITSIQTGKVDPKSDRDFLVVGSPRSLLVYDVEKNMDLFYKEVYKKIISQAYEFILFYEGPRGGKSCDNW